MVSFELLCITNKRFCLCHKRTGGSCCSALNQCKHGVSTSFIALRNFWPTKCSILYRRELHKELYVVCYLPYEHSSELVGFFFNSWLCWLTCFEYCCGCLARELWQSNLVKEKLIYHTQKQFNRIWQLLPPSEPNHNNTKLVNLQNN